MNAAAEPPDLTHDALARRARKRPVAVQVTFAGAPGSLATREGEVRFDAGDALLTADSGERWPVERAVFDASYEPSLPTLAGAPGTYRKRPAEVLVRRLTAPRSITLSGSRGTLAGDAGDWLVQHSPGDVAIVGATIFEHTYELLD